MNKDSIGFIRQHWRLLFHPSNDDFSALIERSALSSVRLIISALEKEDWLTIGEIVETTKLGLDTVTQITSALKGELFDKFKCPETGRGREVAVRLLKKTAKKKKTPRS